MEKVKMELKLSYLVGCVKEAGEGKVCLKRW